MKHFFILGNNPTLSIAEISAVFPDAKNLELLNASVLVLETAQKVNAKDLIKKLGGTIKIGVIKKETSKNDLLKEAKLLIDEQINSTSSQGEAQSCASRIGKFNFGFSFYGKGKMNLKVLGMETKKHLREKNISCRWVTSKEATLSSVVVEQNKLTKTGIEINIIEKDNHVLIGQTLDVQPFKELSYRDYNRPARDNKSGMLPPKLAQIMINLTAETRHDAFLLDPFCGSGTIITEAMLMGYKNLIGSDISKKAVEDTKENISWIQEKFSVRDLRSTICEISATELSKKIKNNSIDAIATEPYLGPQRGRIEFKKTIRELEDLYSKAITEFEKVLKPDGTIVMLFPVFYNEHFINPKLGKFKIINPIPENLRKNKNIKLSPRNTIIYGREGQKVWREIVILKRK